MCGGGMCGRMGIMCGGPPAECGGGAPGGMGIPGPPYTGGGPGIMGWPDVGIMCGGGGGSAAAGSPMPCVIECT